MNSKTRLLITGGSSFLGRCLIPNLLDRYNLKYSYFSQDPLQLPNAIWLDIRDEASVAKLVNQFQPELILHLAGSNRGENMAEVIELGAKHISSAANRVNARLVHLSTDVLFDGSSAPYVESDPPTPIHDYGRAKAKAERIVAQHGNHLIVRTSLIYSLRQPGHSMQWLSKALKSGEPITLFTNQWRNPVEANTLGRALLALAEGEFAGILHIAGNQPVTRAEFSLRLLDHFRIPHHGKIKFAPCDPTHYPADVRLDCRQAERLLGEEIAGIDQTIIEHS